MLFLLIVRFQVSFLPINTARNIRFAKIITLKQQRFAASHRCGIRKAVSKIEFGGMPAFAVTFVSLPCQCRSFSRMAIKTEESIIMRWASRNRRNLEFHPVYDGQAEARRHNV